MGRRISELFYELRAKTEGLQADLQGAERQLGKLSTFITNNPTASALALGAAIGGIAVTAEVMAAANERAFRRVATALGEPRAALQGLRDELRVMSSEFGQSQGDVIALANTIAKNGAGGAKGVREMTKAVLELHAATGEDQGGLALGLDQVLDQFGILPERAEEAAASLNAFTRGKIPLQDLLDVLNRTSKAAQDNKISFEVMAGAGSHLLDIGRTTKQAAAELIALAGGGARGRAELEKMAGEVPNARKALDDLRQAAKDNVAPVDQLKTSVDNLLESLASTGTVTAFTRVLRELSAEIATGAPAASGRALTDLGGIERGLSRGSTPFFGNYQARISTQSLIGELKQNPAALEGLSDKDLERVRAALQRVRTDLKLTEDGARQLALALNQVDAENARREHATPSPLTGSGGAPKPVFDPAAAAAAAAAAEHARHAAAAQQQAVDSVIAGLKTLGDGVTTSDRPLQQYAERLDAIDREFGKIADAYHALEQPTRAQTLAFAAQESAVKSARAAAVDMFEVLKRQEAHKLALDLQELAVAMTPSVVDDMALALEKMIEQLHERRAPEEFIEQLRRMKEAAIDATAGVEKAETAIAALQQRRVDSERTQGVVVAGQQEDIGLAAVENELRAQLLITKDAAARKSIETELLKVEQQRASVHREIAEAAAKLDAANHKTLAAVVQWVDSAAQGARALLESVQAAGLLDAKMAAIANSAITAGESIAKALANGGKNVGADIAAVASLINVGKSLFGKSDEEKESIRAHDANTRAIDTLTKRVGDLARLTLSGSAFAAGRQGLQEVVRRLDLANVQRGGPIKGNDLDTLLSGTGTSFEALQEIAKSLDLTLDGSAQSFRDLAAALKVADPGAFADTWAGAMAKLDLVTRVDRVTDPLAQLQGLAETALKKSGSTLIDSFLKGVDLDDPAARAAVRARARDFLKLIIDGGIDLSTFGNLNKDEILQFLETFIGDIDAVGTAAPPATSALDVLAGTLSDLALLGDLAGVSVGDVTKALDAGIRAFPAFANQLADLMTGVDAHGGIGSAEGQARFKANIAAVAATFAGAPLTDGARAFLQFLQQLERTLPPLATATNAVATNAQTATGAVQEFADAVLDAAGRLSQASQDAKRLGLDPTETNQNLTGTALGTVLPGEAYGGQTVGQVFGAADPLHNPKGFQAWVATLRAEYVKNAGGPAHETIGQILEWAGPLADGLTPTVSSATPSSTVPGSASSTTATSQVPSLTAEEGVRIGDLIAGSYALERAQLSEMQGMHETERAMLAALLTSPAPAALRPPPVGSYTPAAGRAAGGDGPVMVQVSVQFLGPITIGSGVGTDAGVAYLQGVAEGTGGTIATQLGDLWNHRGLVQGGLTVRGA